MLPAKMKAPNDPGLAFLTLGEPEPELKQERWYFSTNQNFSSYSKSYSYKTGKKAYFKDNKITSADRLKRRQNEPNSSHT